MSKKYLMLIALAVLVLPFGVLGQTNLGAQQLGRGYWHVFAAYAFLWALVFAWIVHIARRLARVEEKLSSDGS